MTAPPIPLGDNLPTLRPPLVTYLILAVMVGVWLVVQKAGLDPVALAASVCDYGMVPGELTGRAPVGEAIPIGHGLACVVDALPINKFTPLTSMFLHAGWGHLIGNALFFWVFGNNVEDSMGRGRFLVFYLVCGLAAAAAHVLLYASSPIPTVGASGAISGVLGAYMLLYPRARVNVLFWFLFFIRVIPVQAWVALLFWFLWQVLMGLPQLTALDRDVSGGAAVWAHVGGFVAGVVLVKLFANPRLVEAHRAQHGHEHSYTWR